MKLLNFVFETMELLNFDITEWLLKMILLNEYDQIKWMVFQH